MSDADALLATLRRLAPAKVRVYSSDDESRDIAVPTRRKRWGQVVQTIEARPWVRAELLDRSGAVLGYVEHDEPAGDLEDLGGGPAGGTPQMAAMRGMLELMLRAQKEALSFRDKEHSTLLAALTSVLQVNMENTRELIGIMRLQRDEAMELAQIRAAAAAGGNIDDIVKLIEASPQIFQTLGPLIAMLKGAGRQIAAPAPGKGKP